ncbi:anti-phage protein KwaB [Vibrio crassostreae]|uniref:anti-phage protein KwaB n=1 Tax=Vibrio crassostreae TaxID=246167 RepID=UPI0006377E0F|nr:anti-phage protein KwaB [Vibrio crassostreae]TCT55643.1 uncharacterized protein DUF4868 [Vibrio crassostreae]TCT60124.1 uncharacterized protein DUF4868 [Vibrio crassostreae]TCT79874.1 uncharacterized protein DUF4868 [Vibrio crassostreae]TCT97771.1 uncharacterized protein DUF4868 [Vibrio crassostreae]CAK1877202.1 DUF4868 domain-containing protein [Vibrio crassostreae]
MNNAEIKANLGLFATNCTGIEIFIVDQEDNLTRSDIQNSALDGARNAFTDALKKKYIENESFTIPYLSNHDDRKHALYQFDFDESPQAFDLVNTAMVATAETEMPTYEARDNKLENIKALIIVLKNRDGHKAGFYQHVYGVTLLKSGKGILNLMAHETRVVKLQQDILRVSPNFIFLKMGDVYLVESVNGLENQLNFKDVIQRKAEVLTETLVGMNFSDDFNIFIEKVQEDISFARKVVKVCTHSAVLEQEITTAELIEFVKQEEHYANVLKFNDDETQFDLNSINRCRKFLELLDDDLLRSPLTNKSYIARSKDRV